ncbi:cytochrome P450 [Dactylosporangium sp. CA-139114]|uniref:cytochrome P450 n=1 Tax=Dactylosporangium sp. CA-139114 TaxID=3239931 RepID=UPI003D98C085
MTDLPRHGRSRVAQIAGIVRNAPDFLQRAAERCGDIVQLDVARGPVVLLTDPDATRTALADNKRFSKGFAPSAQIGHLGESPMRTILGDGLLTSRGERHRQRRRFIQPEFHPHRLGTYDEIIRSEADRMTSSWRDGAIIDVHATFAETTLRILTRTAFGTAVSDADAAMVRTSMDAATRWMAINAILVAFAPRLGHRQVLARRAALAGIDGLIGRLLAQPAETRNDLLFRLAAAGLSDGDLRAELLTLLLAGHETSTNALAWACHALAGQPGVLAAVNAEVEADPVEGPLLRAVVDETLRLYPPIWLMVRQTLSDVVLAGRRLPAGITILLSPYVLHRDRRWWSHPAEFDPYRWLTGPSGTHRTPVEARRAYLPFGAGPRACVAGAFAVNEIMIVLSRVLRDWHLRYAGAPARMLPRVTLRPRGEMRMRISRR